MKSCLCVYNVYDINIYIYMYYIYIYVNYSCKPFDIGTSSLALIFCPNFFGYQGHHRGQRLCCLRVPGRVVVPQNSTWGCRLIARPGSSLLRFREAFCMAPFEKPKLLVTLVAFWQSTTLWFASVTIGEVSVQKDEVSKSRTRPPQKRWKNAPKSGSFSLKPVWISRVPTFWDR